MRRPFLPTSPITPILSRLFRLARLRCDDHRSAWQSNCDVRRLARWALLRGCATLLMGKQLLTTTHSHLNCRLSAYGRLQQYILVLCEDVPYSGPGRGT